MTIKWTDKVKKRIINVVKELKSRKNYTYVSELAPDVQKKLGGQFSDLSLGHFYNQLRMILIETDDCDAKINNQMFRPILSFSALNNCSDQSGSNLQSCELSIVTLNVGKIRAKDGAEFTKFILREKPVLVFFQEVKSISLATQIDGALTKEYQCFINISKGDWRDSQLLTFYKKEYFDKLGYENITFMSKGTTLRYSKHTFYNSHQKMLIVYNIHLRRQGHGSARDGYFKRFLNRHKENGLPIVLAGDFNLSLKRITECFTSVGLHFKIKDGYPATTPKNRAIDYVIHWNGNEKDNFEVLPAETFKVCSIHGSISTNCICGENGRFTDHFLVKAAGFKHMPQEIWLLSPMYIKEHWDEDQEKTSALPTRELAISSNVKAVKNEVGLS